MSLGEHAESQYSNYKEGVIDFVAGSCGGIAQTLVTQPLDTIKVKMQTYPTLYRGIASCFLTTVRRDGFVRGLYAGTTPAVIANVAENSVLFAAYGRCQKAVAYGFGIDNTKQLTAVHNGLAGFGAAFFSTFALCPTELVKCKLQAMREVQAEGQQKKVNTWTVCRDVWRKEGLPGFFRGLVPTFWREMPGYFFFFMAYEGSRELLKKQGQTKEEIGPLKTMLAGAIGGTALWVMIFPADVLKSRMQVNSLRGSMFKLGYQIIKTEGILALYSGLLIAVLRTAPATAVLFVTVEYTKKLFNIDQ